MTELQSRDQSIDEIPQSVEWGVFADVDFGPNHMPHVVAIFTTDGNGNVIELPKESA